MVMATTKPISPPVRLADMTREEAETVTGQIKENFDSLGNMLIAARDRKAYKVLGYRSFDSYCNTEFGRSVSSAYELIENAKILEQLESKILENYGERVTIKFPSTSLRVLKNVEDIDDKLKALEYAQKLAESENQKPARKHLELAVFQINGKRSEDFRAAIQGLGFTKGVQVEIISPLKRERGVVTNVDKLGKIYVEQYYGDTKAKDYDATQLRILTNEEKPTNPLEGSVASKGDRVLIYAEGLQGKKGTIYSWREGKTALVKIDGRENDSPIVIAYAEMELLKPERKNTNWEADLSWETAKQTYYYFQKEDLIYSNKWPAGLTLSPYSHELSPIDFMANWEDKFAGELLEGLTTPANLKTSVLAQAIELPEAQGQEFAADLIVSLLQLFPQAIPESSGILVKENQQLREQLTEAETAIQSMITAFAPSATPSALEPLQTPDFLLENAPDNSTPGDTAAHTDFLLENTSDNTAPGEGIIQAELPPGLANQINSVRDKYFNLIEDYEKAKKAATKKKVIDNLNENIEILQKKLENLKKFEQLRIGHTICHERQPMRLGKITGIEFSQGGELPMVWVKYYHEGQLENTAVTEVARMIFIVDV